MVASPYQPACSGTLVLLCGEPRFSLNVMSHRLAIAICVLHRCATTEATQHNTQRRSRCDQD